MADTKITALTAITTVDPAVDVLPIVDVSDTTMAASGTTKKITSNQILGAGGTATLASATITGDLTVDTSTLKVDSALNNVGIGTATPNNNTNRTTLTLNNASWGGQLDINVGATNHAKFGTDNFDTGLSCRIQSADGIIMKTAGATGGFLQQISSTGVTTWYDGAGGTRMTLNSTGLGVGIAPDATKSTRLSVYQTGDLTDETAPLSVGNTAAGGMRLYAGVNNTNEYVYIGSVKSGTGYRSMILQPNGGNVGIGVTPSAWINFKALQVQYACFASNRFGAGNIQTFIGSNAFYDGSVYKYIVSDTAARYALNDNVHAWYTAPSGTAGNTITFTQAMTLDASGNLLVGTTNASSTVGAGFKIIGSGLGPYVVNAASTDSALAYTMYSTGAAAYRFYVGWGGTVFATNTTISAISDARFKENVQDIDVGLGAILALKPRKFDWKEGKGKNIKGDRGFIAQEFEQVFPQLVDEWKDAAPEGEAPYKSVRQDLIPVLVKAIQELTARVQTLETR